MEKAVTRINEAIDKNERILVYGDYDADGVTSTSILVKTLQTLGAEVGWYILIDFQKVMVLMNLHLEMHMMKACLSS